MPSKAFINPRYTPARYVGLGETAALEDLVPVAGTWSYVSYGPQGDYDSLLIPGKGLLKSIGNNNEIKMAQVRMNVGIYTIKIATLNDSDMGIMEVLAGALSLGTVDLYAPDIPGAIYNKVYTFTFSPTQSGLYDIRVKCTGKNGASSAYGIGFSRIQIKKTDSVSGTANITSGSFVGDGTENKGIPHSLGISPKKVSIVPRTGGYHLWIINGIVHIVTANSTVIYTPTAWDATNFYIGQAGGGWGNDSGATFDWVAEG